ncbi:hypothetical protein GP486_001311 [Trichoglossum hirsutum]|uniref:Uncharacterized protein n=1 Tax=Trichoglossum hirsutum TaxID=265104 RepID=A0A9P8RST4_9PEZI|nr:hypothetical protein GP486_001311 [Trichoglossum hirsutum]
MKGEQEDERGERDEQGEQKQHVLGKSQDNYKIVCFDVDIDGIAGRHLDQEFLENPHRPVDQLLRWHFRQAAIANMRGAGEPIFECDFPPGSDIMGEIMSSPKVAERMEFELFGRLGVTDRQEA